ncbi:efflux RND transporter periplasmic adaptor subunit [Pseudoflavonifractor sp.]|uniref:efflux RND transporter periplasmic adaptor subunit n=1 Tax=Pseudoflavonifractor sp. TaxID=1980281 RepID=UPI003D90E2BE
MQLLKQRPAVESGGDSGEKPRKKGRFPIRRVVALVIVVGVVAAAAVGARALFFTEEEQVALTETTTYGTLSTAIEGTATTMPNDSVTVTTASTAEILEVYVSAGDTVEAGDLLYVQDDAQLDEEIETYQDEMAELEEELDGYYGQLSDLQESLSALSVTAPFAGRLTEVDAEEGDTVQNGGKLAVLVDDSRMTLTQYFSYAYADQVYVGMNAGVSVASLMLNLEGTVTEVQMVERLTAEGTKCFAVTVTVDNPGALTEGMTGAGYLIADSGEKIYPAVEGSLEYGDQETIQAQVAGKITYADAVPYQTVSAGQTLFTIDGSDYEEQLETVNKRITQTEEKIASTQEKIDEAEESRSDYSVTAEISGKVISVGVRAGESPRMEGTTAVTIYNMDTMTITANIDELDIDKIEMGMDVTIVASSGEATYQGTVTEISYEATNSSGVAYFPITIEIDSAGELSAGVNVSYYISTGDDEEGVLVPLAALKSTDEGTCVFVKADTRPDNAIDLEDGVVPDGFYAVPVEVGATNSQYARIVSGVEADTEVFTRYQNAAPSGGDTTSQGVDGEIQEGFPGGDFSGGEFPGGGQMPDFSGGGTSGGGMSSGMGGPRG